MQSVSVHSLGSFCDMMYNALQIAEVFAEVNIDARCQSGHVFLPHPAQEYSFWTRGTSQLMSVPGVFQTRPLAETIFPLKCILVVPKKKKKLDHLHGLMYGKLVFSILTLAT